jgi:hypothetical protein
MTEYPMNELGHRSPELEKKVQGAIPSLGIQDFEKTRQIIK